jgi:hypothetical protein
MKILKEYCLIVIIAGLFHQNLLSMDFAPDASSFVKQEIIKKVESMLDEKDLGAGTDVTALTQNGLSDQISSEQFETIKQEVEDQYFYRGFGVTLFHHCQAGTIGVNIISLKNYYSHGWKDNQYGFTQKTIMEFMEKALAAISLLKTKNLEEYPIEFPNHVQDLLSGTTLLPLIQWHMIDRLKDKHPDIEIRRDRVMRKALFSSTL